jgi:hypothetical protein
MDLFLKNLIVPYQIPDSGVPWDRKLYHGRTAHSPSIGLFPVCDHSNPARSLGLMFLAMDQVFQSHLEAIGHYTHAGWTKSSAQLCALWQSRAQMIEHVHLAPRYQSDIGGQSFSS